MSIQECNFSVNANNYENYAQSVADKCKALYNQKSLWDDPREYTALLKNYNEVCNESASANGRLSTFYSIVKSDFSYLLFEAREALGLNNNINKD